MDERVVISQPVKAISAYLTDSRPAWLWATGNGAALWQNAAARDFCAETKRAMGADIAPIKRQIARALRLGMPGQTSLSRMQFTIGRKPISLTCACTPLQLADGRPALLVAGVDALGPEERENGAQVGDLLGVPGLDLLHVVVGSDGQVLAGSEEARRLYTEMGQGGEAAAQKLARLEAGPDAEVVFFLPAESDTENHLDDEVDQKGELTPADEQANQDDFSSQGSTQDTITQDTITRDAVSVEVGTPQDPIEDAQHDPSSVADDLADAEAAARNLFGQTDDDVAGDELLIGTELQGPGNPDDIEGLSGAEDELDAPLAPGLSTLVDRLAAQDSLYAPISADEEAEDEQEFEAGHDEQGPDEETPRADDDQGEATASGADTSLTPRLWRLVGRRLLASTNVTQEETSLPSGIGQTPDVSVTEEPASQEDDIHSSNETSEEPGRQALHDGKQLTSTPEARSGPATPEEDKPGQHKPGRVARGLSDAQARYNFDELARLLSDSVRKDQLTGEAAEASSEQSADTVPTGVPTEAVSETPTAEPVGAPANEANEEQTDLVERDWGEQSATMHPDGQTDASQNGGKGSPQNEPDQAPTPEEGQTAGQELVPDLQSPEDIEAEGGAGPFDDVADSVDKEAPVLSSDVLALSDEYLILNRLSLGLLVFRDQEILFANRALTELVGFGDSASLRRAGLDAIFPAGDNPETPVGAVTHLVRADETLVPVNARLQSITWRGRPALLLSAQERAERPGAEALVREFAKGLAITDQSGFFETSRAGVISSVSGRCAELADRTPEVLIGRPLYGLIALSEGSRLRKFLEQPARFAGEARPTITLAGAQPGLSVVLFAEGHAGVITGYFGLLRQIGGAGGEVASRSGLDPLQLTRLARGIRRPLNSIVGFADLMRLSAFGPIGNARYLDYAHDIKSAGEDIAGLVDELENYAWLSEDGYTPSLNDFDLSELLDQIVARIRLFAGDQRVLVRSAISTRLPLVKADRASLGQAILNVLATAIAETPRGGQVVVSANQAAEGGIEIHIRNSAEESPDALDERFFVFRDGPDGQGQARKPVRSALGLTLTRALLAINRCRLRFDPAAGMGTLISLDIPPDMVARLPLREEQGLDV